MGDCFHYVYILQCSDGSYYTGYSNNVEQRVKVHNEGKGAKYTRGRTPVKLVYQQHFPTKKEALQKEYTIKQLTRKQKQQLIAEDGVSYVAATKLQQ